MQLGWVDFSSEERDKALGILHSLSESGAVDELGFGIVRDAFSDVFFPGTSTLLTRAKYYLVVPYIISECVTEGARKGWTTRRTLEQIDLAERKLGEKLYHLHEDEKDTGIVGVLSISHGGWVKRAPSVLYWSGIRKLGICPESDFSREEYVDAALSSVRGKGMGLGTLKIGEDDEGDDQDAGGSGCVRPFDIRGIYRPDWKSSVDIALTREEAVYLRGKIAGNLRGSLFAFALEHYRTSDSALSFEEFAGKMSPYVDDRLRRLLDLSCRFLHLVYAARVRYNVILQGGRSSKAEEKWQAITHDNLCFSETLVDEIGRELGLKGHHLFDRLSVFLEKLIRALRHSSYEEVDALIRRREIDVKTRSRAKLLHPEKHSPENWVGGLYLDYRLGVVVRLLEDIRRAGGLCHG